MLSDSSVWVDHFRGRSTPQALLLAQAMTTDEVIVGDLILCEVLRGCLTRSEFTPTRDVMLKFDVVSLSGQDLAVEAARNYRLLRSRGVTVRSTIDALIATWCLKNDVWLLHSDRDFDQFEEHLGLMVVH